MERRTRMLLEAIITGIVLSLYIWGFVATWLKEPRSTREKSEFDALRD